MRRESYGSETLEWGWMLPCPHNHDDANVPVLSTQDAESCVFKLTPLTAVKAGVLEPATHTSLSGYCCVVFLLLRVLLCSNFSCHHNSNVY